MPIKINTSLTPKLLKPQIKHIFELSAPKLISIENTWDPNNGAPVFTVNGKYSSCQWTEWTHGFQYGSLLLQYEVTGDDFFLKSAIDNILSRMTNYITHMGVHDHGFNIISTFGNLRRIILNKKLQQQESLLPVCELALKVSGAVQATRWTTIENNLGYIYSFNGPHSLFIDTIRTLRSLGMAHLLGHVLKCEHDSEVSLLERLIKHLITTAKYSVFYGDNRDIYDFYGRVAHESIFNINDGKYRGPSTQQGFSPYSTWMRGLAWAICGFAEELEFLDYLPENVFPEKFTKKNVLDIIIKANQATADFYLKNCCTCGIVYWDSHAPNLYRLGPDYLNQPANPYNDWEPVDSSAAAIAAQGLFRLGNFLLKKSQTNLGQSYKQAALTIFSNLSNEPYLSTNPNHQGLLLHSVYHRPKGWDHISEHQKIPNNESSMWGDYHLRELAILILSEAEEKPYPTFFV